MTREQPKFFVELIKPPLLVMRRKLSVEITCVALDRVEEAI